MIRVRIIAPSAAGRRRLEGLLRASSEFEIVRRSFEAASNGAREDEVVDAIVAEVERRDGEGLSELLDQAVAGAPLILLVHGPASAWWDVIRRGARAILPADVDAPQLVAAIDAAVAGLTVLPAAEAESFAPSRDQGEVADSLAEELTAREIEVLRWMAEGLGNKEIASKLNISDHTVKFHVASILGKLGTSTRTEAVTQGIRRGLVLL
jgi:NarL family two-component system response regulator YdfI